MISSQVNLVVKTLPLFLIDMKEREKDIKKPDKRIVAVWKTFELLQNLIEIVGEKRAAIVFFRIFEKNWRLCLLFFI